jgi:hypothetical protein
MRAARSARIRTTVIVEIARAVHKGIARVNRAGRVRPRGIAAVAVGRSVALPRTGTSDRNKTGLRRNHCQT